MKNYQKNCPMCKIYDAKIINRTFKNYYEFIKGLINQKD